MNPRNPSTTIDHLSEQHTNLLTDLEVDLPSTRPPSLPSGKNSKHTSASFASTLSRTSPYKCPSFALWKNNKDHLIRFWPQPVLYHHPRSTLRAIHAKDVSSSTQFAKDEQPASSIVGLTAIAQSTERPTNIAASTTSTKPWCTSTKHPFQPSLPASSWPPLNQN